jgi:hypothetical protein
MREYEGRGTLHFPWSPVIKGTFKLTFKDNGKTSLEFNPESVIHPELLNLPWDAGRFTGESLDSTYTIFIDKIYLVRASNILTDDTRLKLDIFNPIKITYKDIKDDDEVELAHGLSNFLFYGMETTQRGQEWVRDTVRCILNGQEIRLIQLPDFEKIEENLKEFRDVRATCELKVKGKCKDLGSLRELSRNTQFLCSLASGNYVTEMYEDIFKEKILLETHLFPLKTYPFSNVEPLIDTSLHGIKEFKEYLEGTYQEYTKLKESLGLPYVIEFFITSKLYSPMEVEFLLTTTTLECLESYFADWKKFGPERISMKKKTRRMLDEFKVPYSSGELEFDYIRNFIVHEGRFPPYCERFKALLGLRNLVDKLFLGILSYRGKPYYNIAKQKKDFL